jgi:hypothetical protein
VISGFHYEVDENCGLLGYFTASNGNVLPTFRDKISVPSSGAGIKKKEGSSQKERLSVIVEQVVLSWQLAHLPP